MNLNTLNNINGTLVSMVHLPPQSNPLPSQSYNQPPLSDPQHPDERSYIQSTTVGSWTVLSDF